MKEKLSRIVENRWFNRLLTPAILVLVALFFTIATGGRFAAPRNLQLMLDQALIVATVATGAVFIFATGNVNISMGAATALIATIAAKAYVATQSLPLMFAIAIVSGAAVLAVTALLSTALKVRVLYITVVMMTLLSSLQKGILGSSTVSLPYAVYSGMKNAGLPYIIFGVFFVICLVLFHFTGFGRKLRYIGVNETCAELTGFKKSRYLFWGFVVAGVGVGLGAILTVIRAGSISTDTAASLNMDCMLAIVLGGMSAFGGSRSYTWSAILGAILVTVLNTGLQMLGVSSTIIQAIRGAIFIVLLVLSQKRPKGLPSRDG